ncbi:MAG TPA: hypothetical protein VFZ56_01210 [Gemmatimonadaceae bacterium]
MTTVAAAFALSSACGDGPTDPAPEVPGSITAASATSLAGTAGQPVTPLPSVVVRDQNGDPMFGVRVTFAVTGGGGAITGATAFTGSNGVATVGSWTLGPSTGTNTLTASVSSLAAVTFTATAQAGAPTILAKSAGDAQTAPVATPVPIPPAVIVTDALNNPVAGVTVVFGVASGGGSSTGNTAVTNSAGIAAVGNWTLGTAPGPNTLDATFGDLTVTFAATAVAGAPANIIKEAGDNQSAPAATAVAVEPSVRITDAQGNPVAGVAVTFAVAPGSGSLTGGAQVTDANGIATVGSWTLGSTVGVNTLTASAGSLTATFTATATTGAPANLVKQAGDAQIATVATAVSVDPAVRLTDAQGNPVTGATVVFSASGNGSVTGGTQLTDANGVATVGSWTLATVAGGNTLTATAGTLVVTFTATGTPAAPSNMVKQAGDAQSTVVGTAVSIDPAVRITDEFGNAVPGVSVTFTVSSGGGSVTGETQATDGNGVATVGSWTLGTSAGANALTATAGSLEVIFTATATAAAAENLVKIAGDGQTAVAGTAVAVDPSVRLTDEFANPIVGVPVTFAVTSGGGLITGSAQVTDSDGVATVSSWTLGTTAGANVLSATAGSLVVTFTATGVPGAPANIVKQAGDGQDATVGTAVAVDPAVRITDVHGNAVPNVTVTFAVASGGGSVNGAVQSTDANGVATVGSWTLGPTPGENTLTATAGSLVVTFTATALLGPPANVAKQAGDGQSATVGTAVTTAPAVLVTDAQGNPVPGVTVTFEIASGQGSITGGDQVTDVNGLASVGSWTLGTTAGGNTLTVTAAGIVVTFSATGTADAPDDIVIVAGDGQNAPAGTDVPIAPSVKVVDQYGNGVAGVTVTFMVTAGGGSVTGEEQVTGADGIATVGSWTLGATPGANELVAETDALSEVFTANGT